MSVSFEFLKEICPFSLNFHRPFGNLEKGTEESAAHDSFGNSGKSGESPP